MILISMNQGEGKLQIQNLKEQIEIFLVVSELKVPAELLLAEATLKEGDKPLKVIYRSLQTHVEKSSAKFSTTIKLLYYFQAKQTIKIDFYIISGSERTLIGSVWSTVGSIFSGRSRGITQEITSQKAKVGQLWLKCLKVVTQQNEFTAFNLVVHELDLGLGCFCFGKLQVKWNLHIIKDKQQLLIYQSESKQGTTIRFNRFITGSSRLTNADPNEPIIIRFLLNDTKPIGELKFDLSSLRKHQLEFPIFNPKKKQKIGVLEFQDFREEQSYTFLDYLNGGMQMAMVLCIDFTASNKLQTDPKSLHYQTPEGSQYEKAFHEVCSIVLDYDFDKSVPAYGFGAKVVMPGYSSDGKVDNCFPINGLAANHNVFELKGIVEAYKKCLPYLQFSGPTCFAPLLRQAMQKSQAMKKNQTEYMILLILTDGDIYDKDEVKDLLIECSRLPLSVIIIGIGDCEGEGEGEGQGNGWKDMKELDDDQCLMADSKGNRTERDLVQFVVFSQFKNNGVELARNVLEELPRQVVEYHRLCDLKPQIYNRNLMGDIVAQSSMHAIKHDIQAEKA